MLKILNLVLLLGYSAAAYAGETNKKEVLSLSNGRYMETFDQDSIEQIGRVLYNVNSRQIVGFITQEENDAAAALKPEVISRWLAVDPLAAKYPSISPYAFCANNPILFKDPDGRDIVVTGKEASAFLNLLGARTGLSLTIGADNIIKYEINKNVAGDAVLRKMTVDAIDNTSLSLRVNAIGQSNEVLFDEDRRVGGANPNVVDMGDFNTLGDKPNFQSALLGHIIAERSNTGRNYDPAHEEGIQAEVTILSQYYPGITARSANLDRGSIEGIQKKGTNGKSMSDYYKIFDYKSSTKGRSDALWLRYDYSNGQPNINVPNGAATTQEAVRDAIDPAVNIPSDIK